MSTTPIYDALMTEKNDAAWGQVYVMTPIKVESTWKIFLRCLGWWKP